MAAYRFYFQIEYTRKQTGIVQESICSNSDNKNSTSNFFLLFPSILLVIQIKELIKKIFTVHSIRWEYSSFPVSAGSKELEDLAHNSLDIDSEIITLRLRTFTVIL